MKQWIGALVVAGALAGPLAGETDGAGTAQQTNLLARLTPAYVTAGGTVTVTSVDPCPQVMQVFWSLGPGGLSGSAVTGADGRWTIHFNAPQGAGVSPFFAHCAFAANGNAIAMYEQIDFTIVARRRPRFTG
jgi:hypothetical protein